MMLMTKFGKFKLRFIATINLSVLMSILSLLSTTTNYWVKYTDRTSQETHFAGMWKSCPSNGVGNCTWKNGIISHLGSLWSIFVRFFIFAGTMGNVVCVFIFVAVMFWKIHKNQTTSTTAENGTTTTTTKMSKSARCSAVICLMEWANCILMISFFFILIGFTIFISSECTISLWLHVASMCFIILTSNLLTRTFAALYFQNTRQLFAKNIDSNISHSKLAEYNLTSVASDEEKTALTTPCIEMQKIGSEANHGSKEALIQPTIATPLNITELKTASNTNLNSQPISEPAGSFISMSNSSKAINKC